MGAKQYWCQVQHPSKSFPPVQRAGKNPPPEQWYPTLSLLGCGPTFCLPQHEHGYAGNGGSRRLTAGIWRCILILVFLPPSSSACRMTDGDTSLPAIERKLGLQIWSIEVRQEAGMVYGPCAPVRVYGSRKRCSEVIWIGKEGLTGKSRWETGDPASPYATLTCCCFGSCLLKRDNVD